MTNRLTLAGLSESSSTILKRFLTWDKGGLVIRFLGKGLSFAPVFVLCASVSAPRHIRRGANRQTSNVPHITAAPPAQGSAFGIRADLLTLSALNIMLDPVEDNVSSEQMVWTHRPWTAPETTSRQITKRRPVTPMPISTTLIPKLQQKAADPSSGRVTAETLLFCLRKQNKRFDEWKIRRMVAEADFDGYGLSPATLKAAIEGIHMYREYTSGDWLEVSAMVLGMTLERLLEGIDQACTGTRLVISDPGRSYKRDDALQPVWSRSSSKHPLSTPATQSPTWASLDAERDESTSPSRWSALLREPQARDTTMSPSYTSVLAPEGKATLDQTYVERAINISMQQAKAEQMKTMSFEAQRRFDTHVGQLSVASQVTAGLGTKGPDPRKTQSARPSQRQQETRTVHLGTRGGPPSPHRKQFVSMTGVPPISNVDRGWAQERLVTERTEQEMLATLDPARYGDAKWQPTSSSPKYYRSVRAVCKVNEAVLRPATAAARSRQQALEAASASMTVRHRPSTAARFSSSTLNPGVKADTLRVTGRLAATGLTEGADVRSSAGLRTNYPHLPSGIKNLRHDISEYQEPFVTGSRPLKSGLACAHDFQKSLAGERQTFPSEFWSSR